MSDLSLLRDEGLSSNEQNSSWLKFNLIVVFLLGMACLLLMVAIVPKFEQIFDDVFPGKPLPGLTEFIISFRMAIAAIDFGWPIFCANLFAKQKSSTLLWLNLGIVFFVLQVGITIVAMFIPMRHDGTPGNI